MGMLPLKHEPPLRILLLVEPTPFNYVSGYANRFKEMLDYLKEAGDEVAILTPDSDPNPPLEYKGFNITTVRGFEFILYNQVTLSFDLRFKTRTLIQNFKPDIIHVSTPSALIWPAVFWSRQYNIPLVMSYHTDFIEYSKAYSSIPDSASLARILVKAFHDFADLTLCTSPQLKNVMTELGVRRVDVWQKGINTKIFSPRFKDAKMRERLSSGHSDSPLLLYVGRLGVEKKLHRLKKVLDRIPKARLAFVGKGPAESELCQIFDGYPVYFAGQYTGEELSQAYASADVFVMPSDSETLGFVVLESLASGVPVVGVAAGGLIDLIHHDANGFLAENTEDMSKFSEFVNILISNVEMRKKFSEEAIRSTEALSWEAATSKLRNIQYRAAIAFHRARDEKLSHNDDIERVIQQHYQLGMN